MAPSPSETNSKADETRGTPAKSKRDRPARKYGFACANCRKRKARCDGGLPSCDRCIANGETCYFNKVPSVAYSLALQSRVNACESLLDRLRTASPTERLQILDEHFSNDTSVKRKRSTNPDEQQQQQEESPRSDESAEEDLTELLNETSVDEEGRIVFYGTTSLFHLQPDQTAISRTQAPREPPDTILLVAGGTAPPLDRTLQWQTTLSLNTPSPSLSTSAQTDFGTYLNADVNSELCNELLETYWCWPHHLHLVLCRKIFMRDLINSGPYVTPFLLNAVLAQAARYSDRAEASKLGQYFAQRTLDSLAAEVDKGSSIPTIQALLIFSARECACGRSSQGWLYSGMAFRMMRDMGMHIHPRKLSYLAGQFSQVELALRQQIFWSCYTWDKTMSLCLGRVPTIPDSIPIPTVEMMLDGDDAENEAWKPRFATISSLEVGVSQRAHSNSRFLAYCHLCVIINDVLETLYSKPHAGQHHLQGFFDRSLERLEDWARNLQPYLYVREDSRSVSCPPLHILLLNLLYHATIILLCRPYRMRQPRARKMATTAAEMIDRLFVLHIRRFGFRVITYLESYTMFVASTINILDRKDGEGAEAEAASARLALSLEILRNATSTPSNARCVEIIEQLLRKNEDGNRKAQEDDAGRDNSASWTAQAVLPPQQNPQQNQEHHRRESTVLTPFAAPQQQQQHSRNHPQHHPHQSDLSSPLSPLPPTSSMGPPRSATGGGSGPFDEFPFLNMQAGSSLVDLPPLFNSGSTPPSAGVSGALDSMSQGQQGQHGNGQHGNEQYLGVETPLRWLADNVNTDHSWMMMDMDFAQDLEAHMGGGKIGESAVEGLD